nr:hypothetical protein [Tanacetum cinerariifolium]
VTCLVAREDIGERNKAFLRDLLLEISLVDPIVEEDSCVWVMVNDEIFFVGDTLRLIYAKILPNMVAPTSWDKTLPHKVNIFIWRGHMSCSWVDWLKAPLQITC